MNQELTELERVKMENFGLRQHVMKQQFEQTLAERRAFIAEMERNHPGCRWNDQTGNLDPLPNGKATETLEALANGEEATP